MQRKSKKSSIKKNGFALKAGIGTLGIFVAGVLVFFAVDLVVPFSGHSGMMSIMANVMLLRVLLSLVILGFSLYLIYDYLKAYLELKNKLMLGMVLAVGAFMMFSISSNPIVQWVFGQNGNGVFSVIPLVFAATALGTLAWISAK